MSSGKEAVLAKMLSSGGIHSNSPPKSGNLIQEVGVKDGDSVNVPPIRTPTQPTPEPQSKNINQVSDGPSILEMMMAAQREANSEKEKEKSEVAAVESKKGLGGGFKKGFFGGGGGSVKAKSSTTQNKSNSTNAPAKISEVIEVKKDVKAKNAPFVFNEVQEALEEDKHPLLKQLQQNDWMTPDLVSSFKSNQILSRGFADPKCMAAMQLLQSDPKEAQKRFKDDPEVSRFLQEFGKMMAGHFEALGRAQGHGAGVEPSAGSSSSSGSSGSSGGSGGGNNMKTPSNTGAGIQELGPLHAQALARKKNNTTAAVSSSSALDSNSSGQKSQEDEDVRVQKILQDQELVSLLQDVKLQAILQECGDPVKFQMHMRDPDTRNKIMRLQQAGLVGTAR